MDRPDLEEGFRAVSDKIETAAIVSSRYLTEIGVEHILVGGLAVGAYGHPRATVDVDYIIPSKHYVITKHGFFMATTKIPLSYGNVRIDYIDLPIPKKIVDYAFKNAIKSNKIPVAPIGVLVYLKLESKRSKDYTDVVELFKRGVNINHIYKFIESYSPRTLKKLKTAMDDAQKEGT